MHEARAEFREGSVVLGALFDPGADLLDLLGRQRIAAHGHPLARAAGRDMRALELADDPDTYDLSPGDVLYVPPLGAHCTRVLEGPSLSVTLSILRPTVADVVLGMLQDRITNDPLWSRGLPLSTSDHGQLAEALAMIAEELRDQ